MFIVNPFRFAATGYQPAGALYLDGSADYLSWTPSGAAASDTDKTISFWVKRTKFGSVQWILDVSSNGDQIQYTAGDKLEVSLNATIDTHYTTKAVYRDPTAWTNVVVAFDTNNGTAANRKRLWINGVLQEDADLDNHDDPSDGDNVDWMKQSIAHNIGRRGNNSQFFEGYLADFIGIDGALDADSFGETNSSGIWVPKNPSTISMPSNSFWLAFDDPTHANGVGKDSSGNNNHFTPISIDANNVAVSGPANSDTKEITIYPVIDPVGPWGIAQNTLSNNNLTYVSGTTQDKWNYSTIPISNSDKVYMEFLLNGNSSGSAAPGFNVSKRGHPGAHGVYPGGNEQENWGLYIGNGDGSVSVRHNNSNIINNQAGGSSGDVFMFARDGASAWFGVNNTWYSSGDPTDATTGIFKSGSNPLPTDEPLWMGFSCYGSTSTTWRPYSSQWSYSPPTGFGEMKSTITGIGNSPVQHDARSSTALSEGNLKTSQTSAGGATWGRSRGTHAIPASGKFYIEAFVNDVGSGMAFGLVNSNAVWASGDGELWEDDSINIRTYTPSYDSHIWNESSQHSTSAKLFVDGDIIQMAIDSTNKKVWFGRNNVWYNSSAGTDGNPSSASNPTVTYTMTEMLFPAVWMYYSSSGGYGQPAITMNYGATPFVYTPPTDFIPLSTQNITSGYAGSLSDAIVTTNATEANIKSTTEGAHSFSNWISFLYNADSAEDRIFYASDDSSNFIRFCDDTTVGKASFPTLSGSNNWRGCAIATGATTGIATGTISHSNGSDTSASHGLTSSTSRFSILISSESTSGHDGWFWFHPDMSSGHNIRMAQGGSEAQQNSKYYAEVTSSNAVVKSAAPTGTYRYIVFAENDLVSLYSYINIADSNGPFVHTNNKPEWMLWGQMTEVGGGYGQLMAWSGTHNAYNPWTRAIRVHNVSTAELTVGNVDVIAAGLKLKDQLNDTGVGVWSHVAGQTTCGISIGTPFPLNNRAK